MERYDLTTPAAFADPYPIYAAMLKDDPILRSESSGGWLVSRFADCVAATRSPHLSAARLGPWFDALAPAERAEVAPLERSLSLWSLLTDPPQHTRLRALLNRAITGDYAEQLRPRAQAIVDEHLARVAARGRFELVRDYAHPVPAHIIAEMFGIAREEREAFFGWCRGIAEFFGAGQMTADVMRGTQASALAMGERLRGAIERARSGDAADNLLTRLVAAREGGDRLSDDEILATCVMLVFAVHETIPYLIGSGVLALLRHPAQLAALREDPSLMRGAVDEILRYETPLPRTARMSLRELELGGVRIPAGERVILMLAAANRDPARFPDPDAFDIRRQRNHHLAFGFGPHHCQGDALSYAIGPLGLEALIRRCPTLALAGEPRWQHNLAVRGLESLELAVA